MSAPLVLCFGQRYGGDDAVGALVAERLSQAGAEVQLVRDPSELVGVLLGTARRISIVDAVVGAGEPGTVLELTPEELDRGRAATSTHGLGVATALSVAAALGPIPSVEIIGISIARPMGAVEGLSPAVRASVDQVVARLTSAPPPRRLGAAD